MTKNHRDFIWQDLFGRRKKIRDLDDTHIANIIDCLKNRSLSRDPKVLKLMRSEAKVRGLTTKFLNRAQIPHKDPHGNWMIWNHRRGPEILNTPEKPYGRQHNEC